MRELRIADIAREDEAEGSDCTNATVWMHEHPDQTKKNQFICDTNTLSAHLELLVAPNGMSLSEPDAAMNTMTDQAPLSWRRMTRLACRTTLAKVYLGPSRVVPAQAFS
jgi:hypothetical protein